MDPADILNYCGMLREVQVPGNFTPNGSAKCMRGLFMSSNWVGEPGKIMKRLNFCFLDCQHNSGSVRYFMNIQVLNEAMPYKLLQVPLSL